MIKSIKRHPIIAGLLAIGTFLLVNVGIYVAAWAYFFEAVHGSFHNVIVAGLLAVVLVEVASAVAATALGIAVLVLVVVLGGLGLLLFRSGRARR